MTQLQFDDFGELYVAGTATSDFAVNGTAVSLGEYEAGVFLFRMLPENDNVVDRVWVFGATGLAATEDLAVRDLEVGDSFYGHIVATTRVGALDLPGSAEMPESGASYLLRLSLCP